MLEVLQEKETLGGGSSYRHTVLSSGNRVLTVLVLAPKEKLLQERNPDQK